MRLARYYTTKVSHNCSNVYVGTENEETYQLPTHFENQRRRLLDFDVEETLQNTHIDAYIFNAYLFENQTRFFDEIDDLVSASMYASDADLLSKVLYALILHLDVSRIFFIGICAGTSF